MQALMDVHYIEFSEGKGSMCRPDGVCSDSECMRGKVTACKPGGLSIHGECFRDEDPVCKFGVVCH